MRLPVEPLASTGKALREGPWNGGAMPNDGLLVSHLEERQMPEAARLLSAAFAADPIITHFLNDRWRRSVAFPAFFRAALAEGFDGGHLYGAADHAGLAAVALWLPPEYGEPSPRMKRRARFDRAIVRATFPGRAGQLYRGFEATLALHPHEPHWYLFFIGVHPLRQGRGVGRTLLAPILQTADREELPCYLETPFPVTHEFYRKLGFELRPPTNPFQGAPPLWTMIRKPGAASVP